VKRRLVAIVVCVVAVTVSAACRRTVSPRSALRIAAAADLRYALDEVIVLFRREHPDVVVSATYGSSGNFFSQLINEAPFDLYLSADVTYPRQLAERGLTVPGTEFTYAVGRLAVWAPGGSAVDVEHLGMRALEAPAVTHIAIANPEHAPYGRAAEAAMRSAGVYEQVRAKVVFGENVSQALQFVQTGAADIGIVALSLVRSPNVTGTGHVWEVPNDAHPPLEQGGVVLKRAIDADAARQFRSLLLSAEGRAVLERYGFSLPVA